MSVTLSVNNLAVSTDDRTLRVFFENYSNVEDAVVMKDPKTRLSRGFGFVTFSSDEEAKVAINCLNNTE
ncbi:glycine-rich RNA-binding protein [Aspergillus flavus AF70]|nr:glycine-rich RNA-binding protein [Aspergillus flavus AF70]RAQ55457.1 glycine-rich RNA-binding protein [Aspergillus flavus]